MNAIRLRSLVTDFYSDHDFKVASQLEPALHSLSATPVEELPNLPDHSFGCVVKTSEGTLRLWPVSTPDDAKLSEAYLTAVHDRLPAELYQVATSKVAAALAVHAGSASDDQKATHFAVRFLDATQFKAAVKISHAETAWGLVINNTNRYPLHNDVLTKTAIQHYDRTCEGLNAAQRFVYANNIAKRAAALGVEIPATSSVNRYTNGSVNKTALAIALDERRKLAVQVGLAPDTLDQLAEAAGIVAPRAELESENNFRYRQAKVAAGAKLRPDEIVGVLESFDKLAGVGESAYRRGFPDPYASCFKVAGMDSGLYIDGVDLGVLTVNDLSKYFDADFSSQFLADPLGTYRRLPEATRAVLRQLAGGVARPKPMATRGPTYGNPLAPLGADYANGTPSLTD